MLARRDSESAHHAQHVTVQGAREEDADERELLDEIDNKQFGSWWLLLMRLGDGAAAREELRASFTSLLSDDDQHTLNLMSMTAAILRDDVDCHSVRTWPIHYVADLPRHFMKDNNRVDRLLRAIDTAVDSDVTLTRDYVSSTLVPQVEREVAAEAASRTV